MRSWSRTVAGLTLGAASVPLDLAYLLGAVLAYPLTARSPTARARVYDVTRLLAEVHRRRVRRFLGEPTSPPVTDVRRAVGYLALRWPVGLLGGLVLLLLGYGAGAAIGIVWYWGRGWPVDGMEPAPGNILYAVVAGIVLLFLDLQGIIGVAALERRLVVRLLGPSRRETYERRIVELATSRAEVLAAVNAERRRIERDLHDGVQQRLVALGMLIGRSRRATDPARAADLLRQAHDESARALVELREVAWRVYPAALDTGGLAAALENVAERCPVPVRVEHLLTARPHPEVETVAYFVVCEAVTNAAKHSTADHIDVRVAKRGDDVHVSVRDDGAGGADPAGGGLSGLAQRVAALDGRFSVHSPPGGPTTVTAELPCG